MDFNQRILTLQQYLTRGVRQGLPFSPLIFNMAIQPLISKLHITITGMTFNPYSVVLRLSWY
jgi:hypothetical protein